AEACQQPPVLAGIGRGVDLAIHRTDIKLVRIIRVDGDSSNVSSARAKHRPNAIGPFVSERIQDVVDTKGRGAEQKRREQKGGEQSSECAVNFHLSFFGNLAGIIVRIFWSSVR